MLFALSEEKGQDIRRTARLLFFTDCLRSARRNPEKEHGHETLIMVSLIILAVVFAGV